MRIRCRIVSVLFLIPICCLGTQAQPAQQRGAKSYVDVAPIDSGIGSYYALVIGINQYRSPLPTLTTAVNDAEAVAKVLSERYGFQVKLLTDAGATRDNILGAMDRYRVSLKETDSLLVYYAGHGFADKEEDKAYWIPVDAEPETRSRWIIADELTTRMRSDPARHVLVISDSCYSGGLVREGSFGVRATDERNYLTKMQTGRSRSLMSSGGDEPVLDGGGDGHSIFARAVLQAFQGTDAKEFTGNELFNDFVLRQVTGNADQVPKYFVSIKNSGDYAGDFVFLRDAGKGTIERGQGSLQGGAGEIAKRGKLLFDAKQYGEAIPLLRSAAESGDADSEFYLGLAYEFSRGVQKDVREAVKWYRRAADQGSVEAQTNLGLMYENGNGVDQDGTEAVKWFRKAAENGNSFGQVNLGLLYEFGFGVGKDQAEAVNWYRRAAEQGNVFGQFRLGSVYEYGHGVQKDLALALYWYEKAAAQGAAPEQAGIGRDRLKAAGVVAKQP